MGKHEKPSAWQPDPGDAVNPDLTSSVGAEEFDEDRMGLDPLEAGMDPPERWAGSDRFDVSADEQREGESLDQRLEQETDDIGIHELETPDENDVGRQAADEAGGSVPEGWRTPGESG